VEVVSSSSCGSVLLLLLSVLQLSLEGAVPVLPHELVESTAIQLALSARLK
jgi:hypothetical protein